VSLKVTVMTVTETVTLTVTVSYWHSIDSESDSDSVSDSDSDSELLAQCCQWKWQWSQWQWQWVTGTVLSVRVTVTEAVTLVTVSYWHSVDSEIQRRQARRVGQNRIYTPYMTVLWVNSLQTRDVSYGVFVSYAVSYLKRILLYWTNWVVLYGCKNCPLLPNWKRIGNGLGDIGAIRVQNPHSQNALNTC
jgi:hypothetical protein